MSDDDQGMLALIDEADGTVENRFDELSEWTVEKLASYTKYRSQKVQSEAVAVIHKISKKDPSKLIPVVDTIVDVATDEDRDAEVRMVATMIIKNMKEHGISVAAESSTVTESRLKGRKRYFYDVTNFIKPDEQPHFLFALSHSWGITDGPVVVDRHGSDEVLLERKTTGSVLISDYGVRILSEGGRWALPYQKITGTGTERTPTPTLKIMASGEIYKMRVAKSIHENQQVSEAAKFIDQVVRSI